ncbi:MAG TPA: hypothetical protein VF070_42540 [Streptosporangiaceae bacterium]
MRAGSASARPSANNGIRHNGGTGPGMPSSRMTDSTVIRTRRRAPANNRNASGSSATSAETMLITLVSSCTSNQASASSSVPVTSMKKITTWRWFHDAHAVAANPASSKTSRPTQAPRQ